MASQVFTPVMPTVVLVNGNTACFVPTVQFTLSQPSSNVIAEIVTLSVLNMSAQTSVSVVGGQASGVISVNASSQANTTSATSATPDLYAVLTLGQSFTVPNPGLVIIHVSDSSPFTATINVAGQTISVPVSTSYSGGVYQACVAVNLNQSTNIIVTSTSTTTNASLYAFYTPSANWFTTATLSWVDKLNYGFTNANRAAPLTINALVPLNILPPVQASTTSYSVSYR